MGFEVKIPDNLKKIAAVYDKRFKDPVAKAFNEALSDEVTKMRYDTSKGKDIDGKRFEGYAASTRRKRNDKGRNSSFVDLTWTGNMLRAMQYKVRQSGGFLEGTIYFFGGQADKARANLLGGRVGKKNPAIRPPRKFFGVSKGMLSRITARIRKALK